MAVDYNDLLYEKMQQEYDAFIAGLKLMSSEQIIDSAYEKVIKSDKKLDQVTVSDILLTEGINQAALLRIFDGVTAAFYKSSEYDSRRYRYSDLKELLKYRNNEGKENGNGKTK